MYILAKARSDKILARINDTSKTLPKVEVTGPTLEKIKMDKKIKVNMYDWYRNLKNLPGWFKHGEVADITWNQLQELHDLGLSIMLRCSNDDGISLEVTGSTLEKITLVTKIKVRMIDWFGGADNKPDWFIHREHAEITYKQIQELHEAGLSIMLRSPDKNGICVLAISDSGFD